MWRAGRLVCLNFSGDFLGIFLDILSFCWDILHLTPAQVHLADGIHVIEFEHGTTSGSRVLRVDREVTSFENWETFSPLGYIEKGHFLSQKIHIETLSLRRS